MSITRPTLIAASLVLAASLAHADTPPLSPEQSASLTRVLRIWSLGIGTGAVRDAGDFTATPADGHYDLRIPRRDSPASAVTASARQAADGRWQFNSIALPSPWRSGSAGSQTTVSLESQSGSATVDPTLAAASTGEIADTGVTVRQTAGKTTIVSTMARLGSHTDWLPASPGRVDIATIIHAETMQFRMEPASTQSGAIRDLSVTFQSSETDPDRIARLRQGIAGLAGLLDAPASPTPKQRQDLHALLAMTQDLSRQAKVMMEARDISVATGDQPARLDRVTVTETAAVPDGKLDIRLRLDMAGLDVPGLPIGPARDLLPRHIVLAPSVTGAKVADIYALANRWIDESQDPDGLATDAEQRLAASPVTIGLDELSVDAGPALLLGHGQITISAPGAMDGAAVIQATGLDALIKQVGADPTLKKGVAVLLLLKGIGEQKGDTVEWRLAYHGGKLTVNGTDLSALVPGR